MWKVFTTIWDTIIEDGMVFKKKSRAYVHELIDIVILFSPL